MSLKYKQTGFDPFEQVYRDGYCRPSAAKPPSTRGTGVTWVLWLRHCPPHSLLPFPFTFSFTLPEPVLASLCAARCLVLPVCSLSFDGSLMALPTYYFDPNSLSWPSLPHPVSMLPQINSLPCTLLPFLSHPTPCCPSTGSPGCLSMPNEMRAACLVPRAATGHVS